jgi:alpha-tubulin suppressor-like RCC1 family protein
VFAAGFNGDGQLGNGTMTDSDKPVGVQLPTGVTVKAISAGCDQGYALTTSGQIFAWGLNLQGELGNGTLTNSEVPVAVKLPSGLTASAVFAGTAAEHAFALVRKS